MKFTSIILASGAIWEPPEGTLRVRYSKSGHTLLTFNKEDAIVFGIARCNTVSGDRFSKKKGKGIAGERIQFTLSTAGLTVKEDTFYIDKGLLTGVCHVSQASKLINHFKMIDVILERERKQKYAAQDEARAVRKAEEKAAAEDVRVLMVNP